MYETKTSLYDSLLKCFQQANSEGGVFVTFLPWMSLAFLAFYFTNNFGFTVKTFWSMIEIVSVYTARLGTLNCRSCCLALLTSRYFILKTGLPPVYLPHNHGFNKNSLIISLHRGGAFFRDIESSDSFLTVGISWQSV